MELTDTIRKVLPVRPKPVPPVVEERIARAKLGQERDGMRSKRRLCQLFLEGEVYHYLDVSQTLNRVDINPGARSGKPAHRIRNRYNFIRPMVDSKVSSSTTRVPGYEVYPTTTDPEDLSASRLAEKIVRQGYERWNLREARVKAATIAIGAGGVAYALPYFDKEVGPFHSVKQVDGAAKYVGEGEIKVLILNGNEVMFEDGTSFRDSRWYIVRTARPLSEVYSMEGFVGVKLRADATTADVPQDKPTNNLVMVTLYFERPCSKYPQGRMLTLANDQQIVPETTYPMVHDGVTLDEPVLHELVYRISPDDSTDLGLTWELIDFQRTLQDIYNKIMEIKNRGLNLRIMAPRGAFNGQAPPDDVPGGINYYTPVGGFKPEWERGPDPNIIGQLLQVFTRVLDDMRWAASDTDVQAAPNVATGSIQAVLQQAGNRWSQYLGNLSRFDSELARHCLMLAQEHYTEKRVLHINGRFGWEPVSTFRGADIMGQVDVTVNPASIETHTPTATLQKLAWIQANFPGYIRPEVAIEIALNGSSPDSVIEEFEFDKQRVNNIIQMIRDGSIMDMGERIETDPVSGQMMEMPAWMPRSFDNLEVQMWVYEKWLKSPDADRLPPHLHEVAMLIYDGMQQLQAEQQAKAAAAQTAQAEMLGETNAAKPQPQEGTPMPSTPSPTNDPGAAPA